MQAYCDNFFREFELEIDCIKKGNSDPICQAKQALQYIEIKLKELFQWLKKFKFNSIEDEIHFFKELKCKITSKYIFYIQLLEIESKSPSNIKKLKIGYYEEALNKCSQFSKLDAEFYKYYRSGFIHNDHIYFVRNSYKPIFNQDISQVNYDKRLCTSHDLKVAGIIANDMLEEYLEEKINELHNSCNTNNFNVRSKLIWSGSKVDITELIYSLYYKKMFNGGNNIEIKDIAEVISKAFNVKLDDKIYGYKSDIKKRPDMKGWFLMDLTQNFNEKINEESY